MSEQTMQFLHMIKDFSIQAAFTGFIAAFVGSASSFAIILTGLQAVGASPAQATTGLMVSFITMGVAGILTGIFARAPIGVAWSTPGAALLGASAMPEGGFAVVVGALIVCAGLIVLSGLVRPLSRIVKNIPKHLAAALIAAVLLPMCLTTFQGLALSPVPVGAMIAAWVAVGQLNKIWAVPAALVVFVISLVFVVDPVTTNLDFKLFAKLTWIKPEFTVLGAIGLGVPLYIVTMAGQNIPGVAVMRANDYQIKAGPWFTLTGVFSAIGAPFGGMTTNLAAITAAMMAGEQSHEDRDKRYWAAIIAGVVYVIFGLFTGAIISLVSLAPLHLVQAVAGLALIPALVTALGNAFENETGWTSAGLTFLFGASGLSLFGVSGAFWGLIAGVGLHFWQSRQKT